MLYPKVVLVLRKVAWADPWITTTQESAHTSLRRTRTTLLYPPYFRTFHRHLHSYGLVWKTEIGQRFYYTSTLFLLNFDVWIWINESPGDQKISLVEEEGTMHNGSKHSRIRISGTYAVEGLWGWVITWNQTNSGSKFHWESYDHIRFSLLQINFT